MREKALPFWSAVARRSRDTAFGRTGNCRVKVEPSCGRKRRGAALPAAVQDALGDTMVFDGVEAAWTQNDRSRGCGRAGRLKFIG